MNRLSESETIRLLSSNRTFVGLTPGDFTQFLKLSRAHHVEQGAFITRRREDADACFILVSGCIEQTEEHIPGESSSRQHFTAGTIFAGNMLIKTWPQTRDSVAIEDSSLLALEREAFKTLINAGDQVAFRILDTLLDVFVQDVHSANQKLDDIFSHPDETLTRLKQMNTSSAS